MPPWLYLILLLAPGLQALKRIRIGLGDDSVALDAARQESQSREMVYRESDIELPSIVTTQTPLSFAALKQLFLFGSDSRIPVKKQLSTNDVLPAPSELFEHYDLTSEEDQLVDKSKKEYDQVYTVVVPTWNLVATSPMTTLTDVQLRRSPEVMVRQSTTEQTPKTTKTTSTVTTTTVQTTTTTTTERTTSGTTETTTTTIPSTSLPPTRLQTTTDTSTDTRSETKGVKKTVRKSKKKALKKKKKKKKTQKKKIKQLKNGEDAAFLISESNERITEDTRLPGIKQIHSTSHNQESVEEYEERKSQNNEIKQLNVSKRKYPRRFVQAPTTLPPEIIVTLPPILDEETNQEYSQEYLLNMCTETKTMSRTFGIGNISSFAEGNCPLIKLYYPDVTCSQIVQFIGYCKDMNQL